jgi:SAM-dependent methyltransferase
MERPDIHFDFELTRGVETYGGTLGKWWFQQASNAVHRYAYRKIADYIRASSSRSPRVLVDYACGSGHLLSRLSRRFPKSRLVGIDGSPLLLDLARQRIASGGRQISSRISLVESHLPNLDLPGDMADLVVFAFPNIVPSGEHGDAVAEQYLNADDQKAARRLAHVYHAENRDASETPEILYSDIMHDRVISLNLRHLLKRGGLCVRVEYCRIPREALSQLELIRTGMEDGSLDNPYNGIRTDQWFRVLASSHFRSGVSEDVYHQSGDLEDRTGGYFITVLRAL